jgi:hypothetical protein
MNHQHEGHCPIEMYQAGIAQHASELHRQHSRLELTRRSECGGNGLYMLDRRADVRDCNTGHHFV